MSGATIDQTEELSVAFKNLEDTAIDCQASPTAQKAAKICDLTRDSWGDVWMSWVKEHDNVLQSCVSLIPSFEAAKKASEALMNATNPSQPRTKAYALHLVTNITWRLNMLRTLVDTDSVPDPYEREKIVLEMLKKGAGVPQRM